MSKHIAVIGGGPGGIEAAKTVAVSGGRSTLISNGPVGGRATWETYAASAAEKERYKNPRSVWSDFCSLAGNWSKTVAADLHAAGVKIVEGVASFGSSAEVLVKDQDGNIKDTIQADGIILATGAYPVYPPGLEPDGDRIIAPHLLQNIKSLPQDIVVIGPGSPSAEYVYIFNKLGVDVIWMVAEEGVLPVFPSDAGKYLADILRRRGVKLWQGPLAKKIERTPRGVVVTTDDGTRHESSMVFVSLFYKPDLDTLNLESVDLEVNQNGSLAVNEFLQTTNPKVYAVNVADLGSANLAMSQGRVAGLHAIGTDPSPFRMDTIVFGIYTEPQVSMVGNIRTAADVVEIEYEKVLKSHLLDEGNGFLRLGLENNGRIIGGLAVGPDANDLLAPIALAIQVEAKVDDLASIYSAHPTISELAFAAARKAVDRK